MKITNISKGDILAFKGKDEKYKIIFCTSTYKERSPYHFTFAGTDINQNEKPTIKNAIESNFFGIENRVNKYSPYFKEEEIKQMWRLHPEINPYHLGSYGFIIWRKYFLKFRDKVELIGNIEIVNNLDLNGNGSMNSSSWKSLNNVFSNNLEAIMGQRGQKKYQVKAIIKKNK